MSLPLHFIGFIGQISQIQSESALDEDMDIGRYVHWGAHLWRPAITGRKRGTKMERFRNL